VDEIKEVGFTAISADRVKSPLIAEAQISLECRLVQEMNLNEGLNQRGIVFGEVVLAHVKDELWVDGSVDPYKLRSVGRLGSGIYCHTRDIFETKAS